MATITLDNDTYLYTALKYANEGLVTKALTLLGKCDSYAGHINRIVLLFLRGDFTVANLQLSTTVANFGKQYNVIEDVKLILSKYDAGCIAHMALSQGKHLDNRDNIAQEQIVVIDQEDLQPLGEIFEEEIDFFELADILNGHRMYDIKSVEYLNYIKYKAYLMYAEGKQEEANKLIEQILDTKTDDIEILMWKIMVLSNVREYDKAMNIAEKIYQEVTDINHLCYIAECLREGCGNRKMLRSVVDRILVGIDNCSSDRVVLLMRTCNDYLTDYKLASKFADFILQNYQYFPIDALRDAIWVFLNCGDVASAKNGAMALLQSVPSDVWAATVLIAIASIDSATVTTFATSMPPISIRGIALPRVISHYAISSLANQPTFDKSIMICMRGVSHHCKVLSRTSELTTSLIEGLLYHIDNTVLDDTNVHYWVQLVSDGLLWALYPMDIMVAMMSKLLSYSCSGIFNINLGKKVYQLNTKIFGDIVEIPELLDTMCVLSLLSNMTKGKLNKYMDCLDYQPIDDCFLTASILAGQCGIKLSSGALEELAEIFEWNNKRHAK